MPALPGLSTGHCICDHSASDDGFDSSECAQVLPVGVTRRAACQPQHNWSTRTPLSHSLQSRCENRGIFSTSLHDQWRWCAGSWRLRLGQVLRLYQRLPRSQTPSPSCLAVQSRIRRRMHTLDIESCSFSPSANHGACYPQCRLGNRQLENFQSVALRVPRPRLSPGWSPSAGFGCAPAGSGSGALSVPLVHRPPFLPHSLSRSRLPRPPPPLLLLGSRAAAAGDPFPAAADGSKGAQRRERRSWAARGGAPAGAFGRARPAGSSAARWLLAGGGGRRG